MSESAPTCVIEGGCMFGRFDRTASCREHEKGSGLEPRGISRALRAIRSWTGCDWFEELDRFVGDLAGAGLVLRQGLACF